MPNRYSQYVSGANYAPESFRDMSIVPIALRQRHDAALAAQDDLLLQLNNIQVRDEDKDYLNQKREEITGQVEALTNKINTIGAGDSNLMGEFRNMKRTYNKEVSLAGGLGQAANVKQRIDQLRANYLDYGTKQGWSPETTQKNFEIEYNKWKTNNPSSMLGTEGFAFGEFNPTFAPKQIEPITYLKEIQPLIGEISKEEAFQNYRPVQDANTGQITYVQYGGSSLSKSNLERLKSVEQFLNQKLMNPDSDLRQSLRYSRPGIDEQQVIQQFLSESDLLIDAMGVEATGTKTQLEAPSFSKPTSDKGSSDEAASLVSTPTGQAIFEGKSISDIESGRRIQELEALEANGSITEDQINEKTQLILQKDRINQALKDPNTIRTINNYLKEHQSNYDPAVFDIRDEEIPTTIEGYKNNISNLNNQIAKLKNSQAYKDFINRTGVRKGTVNNAEESAAVRKITELTKRRDEITKVLDEAYNQSIQKDDLRYSRMYTFGAGEANKKATDIFNQNATDYGVNWITQLENAGGKFTLPGETDMFSNNDEDKLKSLKEAFANGQAKVNFNSIIDMGSTGSSQIAVNYTIGEGKDAKSGMITVDFDNKSPDTSVLENWLVEMQKTLDVPGQAVIQSILDNKQLKSLSVDNKEFAKKGFSEYQSNTIKKFNNQLNQGYRLNPEYKSVDYLNYPGREFNMVLNQDGFYQLYMKDSKNKETRVLSAGLWLKKEFTKDYVDKKLKTTDINKATDYNDKKAIVSNLMDLALISDNNSLVQIDNNSSSFQKLKNDFISELNKNQNNINLQYELAVQFYDSIKNLSIAHKNKKRNL